MQKPFLNPLPPGEGRRRASTDQSITLAGRVRES